MWHVGAIHENWGLGEVQSLGSTVSFREGIGYGAVGYRVLNGCTCVRGTAKPYIEKPYTYTLQEGTCTIFLGYTRPCFSYKVGFGAPDFHTNCMTT